MRIRATRPEPLHYHAMPDVVVVRVVKDEWDAQVEQVATTECARSRCSTPPPPPPPRSLLARLRRLLILPIRKVRIFLNRLIMDLWKRLFGPQPKP